MNEEAVGRAVRRSGVPRRELFITTKLWVQNAGYEKTKAAFEQQMKLLGLDCDCCHGHEPKSLWRHLHERCSGKEVQKRAQYMSD